MVRKHHNFLNHSSIEDIEVVSKHKYSCYNHSCTGLFVNKCFLFSGVNVKLQLSGHIVSAGLVFFFFFKDFSFFLSFFLSFFIYLFLTVLGLRFARGPSPAAASGGHPSSRCGDRSSSRCAGLSLSRPLPLRGTGSRRAGSAIVAHGPSRSAARGIPPDQGPNPCPLH